MKTENKIAPEHWNTKIGVIMAVAGSAIGLGNFLRFPGLAAQYGGGAFMLAYFVSFLLLGLPICWVEWAMGRRAGRHGLHGAPFMMVALTGKPWMRYFGVLMLLSPMGIYIYYVNIEAWCLGYAVNFASGGMHFAHTAEAGDFFSGFVGMGGNGNAIGVGLGKVGIYIALCFLINFYLLYRGISKGIEKFCLIATPGLFIIALIVLVRVLTLGTPDPAKPENNIRNGLGYMWNPDKVMLEHVENTPKDGERWITVSEVVGKTPIDEARAKAESDPSYRVITISMWRQLCNPQLWMSAASQLFFSLSVGFCLIFCYASYLRKSDDVVLSALSATSANEFAEIGMGGLLTIPAGYAFLGVAGVAGASTFGLGFNVLPLVFSKMPEGGFFGTLFFTLLFIAAVTSSISIIQPVLAYIEESITVTRRQSVAILCTVTTLGAMFVAYFSGGLKAMDTLDFWFGTFLIFILATVQMIVFPWFVGTETIFREMKLGAVFIPHRIFRFIIKYVTPLFLVVVVGLWVYYELLNLDGGEPSNHVADLFIHPDSVVIMSLLLTLLSGLFLAMLLKPHEHFHHLAKHALEVEKEEK